MLNDDDRAQTRDEPDIWRWRELFRDKGPFVAPTALHPIHLCVFPCKAERSTERDKVQVVVAVCCDMSETRLARALSVRLPGEKDSPI